MSRIPHTALALLLTLAASTAVAAETPQGNPTARLFSDDSQPPRQELDSNPDMYLDLIGRMQGKQLYFASLAHLDAFERRWPGDPRATLMRADALRETGHFDKAAALYQGLLQGTHAAGAQHGLGLIASKQGRPEAALPALLQANQLDPTNAAVLNDLGYVQLLTRQWDEAGINLHKATELDPKDMRAGANLALFYLLDRKPERARGIMDWYRLGDRQRREIYDKAVDLTKPKAR